MNELSLFDSLFGNTMDDFGLGYSVKAVPKVDVKEDENEYNLEMELPGKTEKDVDIQLDRSTLTISSKKEEKETKEEKKDEKKENKTRWIIKERRYSSFSRSFTLPEDVDEEKVSASFKNGILTVKMPRKALASPKRIAIECA